MKKLWFPLMLVFILLSVSACNAEQECPVEVRTGIDRNMLDNYYVSITSISDSVTIKDVIVNRGNTKHLTWTWTPEYPITLKFGSSMMSLYYEIPPKEIEVQTNTGNWVFKP